MKASKPPADAPTPTTGKRFAGALDWEPPAFAPTVLDVDASFAAPLVLGGARRAAVCFGLRVPEFFAIVKF